MIFQGTVPGTPLFVMFNCASVSFPCGILGDVWYLIVSIPDLCHLSIFRFTIFNGDFVVSRVSLAFNIIFSCSNNNKLYGKGHIKGSAV